MLAAEAADTVQKDQASEETKDADGAAAQEAKDTAVQAKVRVAFPTQEGMSYIGHSGKVTGYNYDYLEKVSEYTGLEMDYVAYPSDDGNEAVGNAMNDLIEGKVDLMGPMLKTEQAQQLFEFPAHSYGTVYTTLCALVSSDFREHNLKDHNSFRVGLWEQAQVRNSEVLAYLESENMPAQILYYETADAQKQALIDGEVDMISSVSLSPVTNTRIVAQFAARPFYFAASKENGSLIRELDTAIARVNQVEPQLQDMLYDSYFRNSGDMFSLTEEQKANVAKKSSLQVLCVDHDAPYVYQQKGEPAGMLVSILDDFAEEMGLDVTYTFCDNRAEAEQLLSEHSYDILAGLPFTSGYCAQIGYVKSEPVIASGMALVRDLSAENTEKKDAIAVVNGLEDLVDTSDYEEVQLHEESVDLHAVVDSCRKIMENRAVEAGLSFETPDLAAFDPPRVRASERHLRQIFINLIGNAVKYNRPGGRVVLTAKVASRTADAVTCQFGVSDTGIGMSKAFQSRMFEPFSQEQTESPSEYRGTGLGLSIVKAMIDQMGGQITVDSRKGEGTDIVWTLTFPIDREYRETADPEAPAELDLTGKRILAAEDNALNAKIVEMMLEEAGARVTLVDNGKALVEAFAASPAGSFDYILTDVMMPVMDGYEACRAIRAMERADAAAIPIVAMTANAFSEDIRRSLDAGMNAHISKPFDVNKLKQSLAKL